jgi:hypothetical protein
MNVRALELKDPSLQLVLYNERARYLKTGNPRHAWRSWLIARKARMATPAWVVAFFDEVAAREVAGRRRKNADQRTQRHRKRGVSR